MFKIFQESKSIKWLNHHKDVIDFSPPYQRLGGLWKKEQKQLLIDSILNGFDIPKFYFQFMPPKYDGNFYNYAIIDGKQRIEAIMGFLHDEFPLADTFSFLDAESKDTLYEISGKCFSEIERCAPAIAARFWQYELCVVFMDTTDPNTINEMFIRLNSGVAANTAEKRNATGGKLSFEIQTLCKSSKFFSHTIRIDNKRFDHHDLLLKFLMIEMDEWTLTKDHVDKFVVENRDYNEDCAVAMDKVKCVLDKFETTFYPKDILLCKKNIILTLYAINEHIPTEHLRSFTEYFETKRIEAIAASKNNQVCDPTLIEFSRLLQQGADKKNSIQRRCEIMLSHYKYYLMASGTM